MTLLFAASEVGSWRALAPVARACVDGGMTVLLSDRGAARAEAAGLGAALHGCGETPAEIDAFLMRHDVQAVVFSSNVSDPQPLGVARRAGQLGLPTMHVLDYWNGYAERLRLDGLAPFLPDVYAVPDDHAKSTAIGEGIPASRLLVAGQPLLADIAQCAMPLSNSQRESLRAVVGLTPDLPLLLFVSEPVTLDQGSDPASPSFRGYTEQSVLRSLLQALQPLAGSIQLGLLPHPREDASALQALASVHCGNVSVQTMHPARGRDALPLADGVAGMSSTLLDEAWLLGLPVASIQPGLRLASLARLRGVDGILFLDAPTAPDAAFVEWTNQLGTGLPPTLRPEAALHTGSPERLRQALAELLHRPSKRTPQGSPT